MHDHQLLHRDIKPSNILIDQSTWAIKITDFGLGVALVKDNDTYVPSSTIGEAAGTIYYMAPELYQEQPIKIDKCNDIWSFACTYREFLSTKTPYDKIYATAMNRLVHKIPPSFTDLNFSPEDVQLLAKCFEIKI